MISLLFLVPSLLLVFAVAFIIYFIVIPVKEINSYKGPGVKTHFFPITGYPNYLRKGLKEKGDFMAFSKETSRPLPSRKYLVTNFASSVLIALQDPQYTKEFLGKQQFYIKSKITEALKLLAGDGLALSEGDVWKRHRRIVSGSFHYDFLEANIHLMRKTANEYLDCLTAEDLKQYDAIVKFQQITGEIVGRIFFGENLSSYTFEEKPLTLALADLILDLTTKRFEVPVILFGSKIIKLPIFPSYMKTMTRVRKFREFCLEIIRERKAKPQTGSKDLLSSLLATQNLEDINSRFSDEDVLDEFITFFIGGMDTTGHLIGMAVYNLATHPEYFEKLREEREKTYNNKEKKLCSQTLAEMEILHSFLKETLRFYSPSPTSMVRIAVSDHQLLDLKVKKGQFVVSDLMYSAFDEKNFEEPQKFNPERWMNANPKARVDPYAFIPFSAGPRNCIGQHLAMIESKIILSEFLERFDFDLPAKYELRMKFRFLYEPEDTLLLTLHPKKH